MGLVEWCIAKANGDHVPTGRISTPDVSSKWVSLPSLLGVTSRDLIVSSLRLEDNLKPDGLMSMMLGCRKGVKWYGHRNTKESLFNDDIMAGSLLNFRVDYTSRKGSSTKDTVQVWLVQSQILFRESGWQSVQMARKPIFQADLGGSSNIWVPAVTLHSPGDEVVMSWSGTA